MQWTRHLLKILLVKLLVSCTTLKANFVSNVCTSVQEVSIDVYVNGDREQFSKYTVICGCSVGISRWVLL